MHKHRAQSADLHGHMESIRLKYIEATTTDPDVEYLIKLISYTTYVHREQPCIHLLLLLNISNAQLSRRTE